MARVVPVADGMHRPTVLCPIDLSDRSSSALCYAAAIADHFGARMLVLAVDRPLLVAAADDGGLSLPQTTAHELRCFMSSSVSLPSGPATTDVTVTIGTPGSEILRVAKESEAELIVMSTRRRSGVRKMFLGSTTERVLRDTTVPVLVTPDERVRVPSLPDLAREIGQVLAPVDLTSSSRHQVSVAAGLASALSVPLLLAHILEPVPGRASQSVAATHDFDVRRRANAEAGLSELARSVPEEPKTLVLAGDPSEEIAKLAEIRGTGLIVMGLHASDELGPRMGSVTYRVLCHTHCLTLALPPKC